MSNDTEINNQLGWICFPKEVERTRVNNRRRLTNKGRKKVELNLKSKVTSKKGQQKKF